MSAQLEIWNVLDINQKKDIYMHRTLCMSTK